jgi:amidophosphoribosyltransferase
MKESCGIFGIYSPDDEVARTIFFALFALQHRGQESSGIASTNGKRIYVHTGMGWVPQVFDERSLQSLPGYIGIGHNRYSTTGASREENAQPVVVGDIAVGHNGNIINASALREELKGRGYEFSASTDSEVIAALMSFSPGRTLAEKIGNAMGRLKGAYSLVILTPDCLIGVRDPLGVRPLCLGKYDHGFVIASESCALDHIGANFWREVDPGEIVMINENGLNSFRPLEARRKAICVFEYIYFARPDSVIGGRLLYDVREKMGRRLTHEYPVEADMVIGIPDSATVAGVGYSEESGIPLSLGLVKNRYVGRTFIEPDQRIRDLGVKLKFNPLPHLLRGKKVVVVDDSIVRGTTTPRVVSLLRQAGAKEIHLRISSPPIRYPCFFGVDMATQWELIASQKEVADICELTGADSLGYLSLPGLTQSVGLPSSDLCLACLTGEYPIPVQLPLHKLALSS